MKWPERPKATPLTLSLIKNLKPKTKNFFHCGHEDLLNLLRVEQLSSTIVGRDIPMQKYMPTAGS